jgi:hypothetical protein
MSHDFSVFAHIHGGFWAYNPEKKFANTGTVTFQRALHHSNQFSVKDNHPTFPH